MNFNKKGGLLLLFLFDIFHSEQVMLNVQKFNTPQEMNPRATTRNRIQSIDWLRGWVMLTMTLDHTRDYFHADAFFYDPTDLSQTTFWIFMTRFITHYCAPVFVLLAGTSAWFVGQRRNKRELSIWLVKRGLWLIFLELTIIKFAWAFKLDYSIITVQVIWALGAGMITLAGFIHLKKYLAIAIALTMIAGHNLLDGFQPKEEGILRVIWNIIHVFGPNRIGSFVFFVAYPVIPWLGLMLLGYYLGELYHPDYDRSKRLKILLNTGIAIVFAFFVLRFSNLYGDPVPWENQKNFLFTILSFINVSKYPPSLLYLMITIGPTFIFLYIIEKFRLTSLKPLVVIGRVPMFWYVLHIYLIHLVALIVAVLTGYTASSMIIDFWINEQAELQGYGFNLGIVYLIWILICLALYPLSYWYDKYKSNNKDKWWLSYL